jgi:hypothetical protein
MIEHIEVAALREWLEAHRPVTVVDVRGREDRMHSRGTQEHGMAACCAPFESAADGRSTAQLLGHR